MYVASSDDSGAAVILGSQDALAVQRRDPADAGRFTLFGEFLEKGVIRRARPWLLLNRNDREIHADWIEAAAAALANSPLPLN